MSFIKYFVFLITFISISLSFAEDQGAKSFKVMEQQNRKINSDKKELIKSFEQEKIKKSVDADEIERKLQEMVEAYNEIKSEKEFLSAFYKHNLNKDIMQVKKALRGFDFKNKPKVVAVGKDLIISNNGTKTRVRFLSSNSIQINGYKVNIKKQRLEYNSTQKQMAFIKRILRVNKYGWLQLLINKAHAGANDHTTLLITSFTFEKSTFFPNKGEEAAGELLDALKIKAKVSPLEVVNLSCDYLSANSRERRYQKRRYSDRNNKNTQEPVCYSTKQGKEIPYEDAYLGKDRKSKKAKWFNLEMTTSNDRTLMYEANYIFALDRNSIAKQGRYYSDRCYYYKDYDKSFNKGYFSKEKLKPILEDNKEIYNKISSCCDDKDCLEFLINRNMAKKKISNGPLPDAYGSGKYNRSDK